MNIERQSNHIAGFLFVVSMLAIAALPAYTFVGDYVEKGLTFLSGVLTLCVVIALASIWRGVDLLKPTELKALAIALPLFTVIQFIYLNFAYPDQNIFKEAIGDYILEVCVYLIISGVLWKAAKK